MPRKNKRSQAQKLHQLQKKSTAAKETVTEPLPASVNSPNKEKVTHAVVLNKVSASLSPSIPAHVNYSDEGVSQANSKVVMPVPEPPCTNILTHEPIEISVCASRSQDSARYDKQYRNKQCTCNSLTFLAFLHECEDITSETLNDVLDNGHEMYKKVRLTNPNDFLMFIDLPNTVPARNCVMIADLTEESSPGTFKPPVKRRRAFRNNLESQLSLLFTEVQYGLLIMVHLCIAVFRTRSGRYGFFDPHSRRQNGLPLITWSHNEGTAVMVTFTHLGDMIKRLNECFTQLGVRRREQFDFQIVKFTNDFAEILIPDHPLPVCCPPSSHVSAEESMVSTQTVSTTQTCAITSNDVSESNLLSDVNMESNQSNNELEIPCDLSKYSKSQRRRIQMKLKAKSKSSQCKEKWRVKDKHMYSTDKSIKAKKRAYSHSKYHKNPEFRENKKRHMKTTYKDPITQEKKKQYNVSRYETKDDFRQRHQHYTHLRYHNNLHAQQKQRDYITQRYEKDEAFKQSQKDYITQRYEKDEAFKQSQKDYITQRYEKDEAFKQSQKDYITQRYEKDEAFKQSQKDYMKRKRDDSVFQEKERHYKKRKRADSEFQQKHKDYMKKRRDDPNFKQKQKLNRTENYRKNEKFRCHQRAHIMKRYSTDRDFRARHKQLMKQIMLNRYHNDQAYLNQFYRRRAMKITNKYRNYYRRLQRNEPTLMEQAISNFREHIKFGPTYVCTVCHKASFPNQVKLCKRSKYKVNVSTVKLCLTGKYVHMCNNDCGGDEQCQMTEERKKEWICHTCDDNLSKGVMPNLAVANGLELFDIPPELSDLNILERHLISKCIPFAKIIPLPKGRQMSIRGNVVCVPSEIQGTVEALPRLTSESQVLRVKLKRKLCYRGHQLFQNVTWSKLMQALHKLKAIHPQYHDITIRDTPELCDPTIPEPDSDSSDDDDEYDEADLAEIEMCERNALCNPDNESDMEIDQPVDPRDDPEQEGDMPNGGFALDSCLQPPDLAEDILSFSEGIYSVAPAERNSPVSFFKTPKLEAMAYPVQFPTGKNTLDEQRRRKLSPSMYFKSRLFCIDERFARDTNYLFFAQFVIELHLATSSMSIQLRKGKALTRDGRKITSGMLQSRHEVEQLIRNKEAFRFMRCLRGTPAYWHQRTQELHAMIRQLGTPTFFCTFSAAEMRWPEVIQAIKKQQGEEVNFEELNWSDKCDILRSNPVTAMRMFDKRVEALFRDLLLSPAQPLGKVVDYFYRVEFQHRGSPHIHCLLWVEGAPDPENDDEKTVCDFVDKYITGQLPDPDREPALYEKVLQLQKHSKNHTKSCYKSLASGCRFGFPKPPCSETMISRENDDTGIQAAKTKLRPLIRLLNEPENESMSLEQLLTQCELTLEDYEQYMDKMHKSSTVILKREAKDCWINNYNPHLLSAWDANIDVSYILNAYSCVSYLMKYITKKESGLSDYLKTVIQNSNTEKVNKSDEMKEIMQLYSKKREISAQECVARACGLSLKKCTRCVVFIPTDDNPVKMSRPMSFLENTTDDCTRIWMTSLQDKYQSRPETPEFEEMCLADFVATCRFVSGDHKGKNVFPLLNDLGFVQRRRDDHPAIIRYHRVSKDKNSEQYFGNLLKMYFPHRSVQELKGQSGLYKAFFTRGWVQDIVKENQKKYEKNCETFDAALEQHEQDRNVVDEWCNLEPESEIVRLHFDDDDAENEQENVPDYNPQPPVVNESRVVREPPTIEPSVLRQMFQNLNQKQACVFYAVREWCLKKVSEHRPQPFYYFINGGAGTGKSHLIKCIHAEASKILSRMLRHCEDVDLTKPSVLLTSFTGTAAFNISGITLHSLLKLPRSLKPPIHGLGNQLDEVRCELLNAEIMIIDEVSMVSKQLFVYVDARLRQIKGIQRPFGGMCVIAVGDFYQLPPVRQSKPLCVPNPSDIDLWQEHFQMITLTEIMRQKDDITFAEMLNRIRVKRRCDDLSDSDRYLISQAVAEPAQCPKDVLHIFATNKQVATHNSAALSRMNVDVVQIDADDFLKDRQTGRMARQDKPLCGSRNDLPDSLKVAVGARVMLTRNIDIKAGLVNGAFGTLMTIVTSDRDQRVTKLGLQMDNHCTAVNNLPGREPSHDSLVYIDREEDNLKQKGAVRRQFPVKLAFACTIHKVQGMTSQAAVVSLKCIFEPGMAYVALSRVTSLSGLYITDMDEKKIYSNQEVTASLSAMRQLCLDDVMPLLQLKETLIRPDVLTIIHHNTEGLPAHITDLKTHHELLLADVLCLTESHLQDSFVAESLHLEGYTLFQRNRHLSYNNFPDLAGRRGGGVAVYVRHHLHVVEKKFVHNVTDLEFLVLKVVAPVSFIIAVIYRPPDYHVTSFLSNVRSLVDYLQTSDCQPIIICGDFNENLFVEGSKPIFEFFQSRGFVQLISASTTDKHTALDLFYVSNPQHCLHSGVLRSYYSYHNPVYCVLSFSDT